MSITKKMDVAVVVPPITEKKQKSAKPLIISVRMWISSLTKVSETIAYQVLDNRLLNVVFAAIENATSLLKHHEQPSQIKAMDMKIEKASHRMLMNQRLLTKRHHIHQKNELTIKSNLDLFPQKPLFLAQDGLREMQFQPCLPFDPDPPDLLDVNLPFVLPASVMLHTLLEFRNLNRMWLWTFKLDGVRLYWVFMTIGKQKFLFWVNRKGKTWIRETDGLGVPDDMYEGTILDGELTLAKSGQFVAFTIHDCYYMCGKMIGQRPKPYRLNVAYHGLERWNDMSPSSFLPIEPFFRPAYMIERWVASNLVVRVKQFYGERDVAYLLDRVMPYAGMKMDGLIAETSEDSMFVKPKKYKNIDPPDLQARIYHIDAVKQGKLQHVVLTSLFPRRLHRCCLEAVYSVWAYDHMKKRFVEWTEHGFLTITKAELPTGWTFETPHNRVLEIELIEKTDYKGLKFLRDRDAEKKLPNDIRIVRSIVKNCRDAIQLNELFPAELFVHGHKIPEAAQVIELRTKLKLGWDEANPQSSSISLPAPIYHVPSSASELKKAWVSAFVYQSLID